MRSAVLVYLITILPLCLFFLGCGDDEGDVHVDDIVDGDTPTDGDASENGDNPDDDDSPDDGDTPEDGDTPDDGDCPDEPPEPSVPVDPENWPPEENWWNLDCGYCDLPICDNEAERESDFEYSGIWVKTVTTTDTDCDELIASVDERAIIGNVFSYEATELFLEGQCFSNGNGTVIGVLQGNTEVYCEANEQLMGVVSLEVSEVIWSEGRGTGFATAYLLNLPEVAGGGSCAIELDLVIELQQ